MNLTVTVPYGRSIPNVTKEMCDGVVRRAERLTGLEVTEVDITIRDVSSPNSSEETGFRVPDKSRFSKV